VLLLANNFFPSVGPTGLSTALDLKSLTFGVIQLAPPDSEFMNPGSCYPLLASDLSLRTYLTYNLIWRFILRNKSYFTWEIQNLVTRGLLTQALHLISYGLAVRGRVFPFPAGLCFSLIYPNSFWDHESLLINRYCFPQDKVKNPLNI